MLQYIMLSRKALKFKNNKISFISKMKNRQPNICVQNKNVKTQCFDSKTKLGQRTPKIQQECTEGRQQNYFKKHADHLEFQCK